MRPGAFLPFIGLQLCMIWAAIAQTSPPGVTAVPDVTSGRAYWLWVLVASLLIGMGIWYFVSRQRK
jgi:hypothetical protein